MLGILGQFGIPELDGHDVLPQYVIKEHNEHVRVVLEQVLECPITCQVKIFRSGKALGIGVLLFLTHFLESWVIVNQSPAMTVAFTVKVQLGHARLVNGCFGLRTVHSLNNVD